MSEMMEILKKIEKLAIAPVSEDADIQNKILCEKLPFKILEYKTGREHNGWIVPQKWKVLKAEIRKNGKLIYEGIKHPLGVIGYSEPFRGIVSLEELKKHLFYKKDAPNNIVYHCDFYYKPFKKTWGFSIPYNLFCSLEKGEYEIDLQTKYEEGSMKVLEYTHEGKSKETIILNAHNCHAAQLNDGPSGYVVGIEVMKRLMKINTNYTYKLIIAPEHLGTIFYLADLNPELSLNYKFCIFLEMLGNNSRFALQETFTGESELDKAAEHYLKSKNLDYYKGKFRKIVGNDETVWEAAGIEIPTISLSRCESPNLYYPEYHLDSDNLNIINEDKLNESVDIVLGIIDILEKDCYMNRKFTGLIALSNPKYNLYMNTNDPSIDIKITQDQLKWNYLMDCLPRYFNKDLSILEIAIRYDIPFNELYNYLIKFKEKNLIEFIDKTKKPRINKIMGDRIYLQGLDEKDASEDYCRWLNDPEVNKYLETRQATIKDLKKYIIEKNQNKNCLFLGIFDKENNKHIGNLKLEPISFSKKKAIFSILIGDKEYWSKGYGTEATKLIIDYAFNSLNLDTIILGVIPENKVAIKVYEKVGFKIIGIREKSIDHNGVLYDDVVMEVRK